MPKRSRGSAQGAPDVWVYESGELSWAAEKHCEAVLSLIPRNSRILEVGCGTGDLAQLLAKNGNTVTAIELAPTAVALAKKHFPDIEFRVGSAYDDLKKKFGQFDVIVAVEVVEHLVFPNKFIERAYGALREGGLLITTTPYHGKIKNVLLALSNRWERHFDVEYDHLRFFTLRSLTGLFRKAGFSNFRYKMIGKIPLVWHSFATAGSKITAKKSKSVD